MLVYHSSNSDFDKFDFNCIGKNGKPVHGYGMYFDCREQDDTYGIYHYKVEIQEDDINFLYDQEKPTKFIINKIKQPLIDYLLKYGEGYDLNIAKKEVSESIDDVNNGVGLYCNIALLLGDEKRVSSFLYDLGIGGLLYNASGSIDEYHPNLVVFGPKYIKIISKSKSKSFENMNNVDSFKQIAEELCSLYEKKNHDYGNSFGKTYESLGIISAITRISDKYNRLVSLTTNKDKPMVNDESLNDTLKDMASYCIMTIIELNKKKNETV